MSDNVIWTPHEGQQTKALSVDAHTVLYGGARGGGKTEAGLAWLIEPQYLDNPQFRALVLRRNYDDLRDWIDRAKFFYRFLDVQTVGNPTEFRFPSGAKFRTGHLSEDTAFQKYLGHQYHKLLIEEVTLIPNELDYERVTSSVRSPHPEMPPRIFLTTNPGGQGHNWVKKRFVKDPNEVIIGGNDRTQVFIPSTIYDNPTLVESDPDYVKQLESLPEELRKMWLLGDWDVFQGQFFSTFNRAEHVVDPYEIPESWYKYRCIDYGYRAPFACLWFAVDFDQNVHVYREHYEAGQELHYHINKINELSGDEDYMATIIDPSTYISNPQNTNRSDVIAPSNQSIADIMLFKGIPTMRANNNRMSGWNLVREYLHETNTKDKKGGDIKIFKNCSNLIEEFATAIYSKSKPEDLDTDGSDHALDSLRYGLMHLGKPHLVKEKTWIEKEIALLQKDENTYTGLA